jgi:hypothetical protein
MARFAFCTNRAGNLDVHAAGCADIARGMRRGTIQGVYHAEARNVVAAVEAEIVSLNGDEGSWAPEHFKVLPCARKVEG